MTMEWKPIETAPKDGEEDIIVGCDQATVWIVRSAWWRDGDDDFDRGWWSYKNSVTQELLAGVYEPTHWLMVVPDPPIED